MRRALSLVLPLALLPATAAAQTTSQTPNPKQTDRGFYASAGLGVVNVADLGGFDDGLSPVVATLRAGYDIRQYFGVEADLSLGLSGSVSEATVFETFSQSIEARYSGEAGLYFRGRIPVQKRGEIYGRIGFGERTVAVSGEVIDGGVQTFAFEQDVDDSFVALGIGAQFVLSGDRANALRFDLTARGIIEDDSRTEDSGTETSATLSFVRRF